MRIKLWKINYNPSKELNCFASQKSCTICLKSLFFFVEYFLLDFVHNSFRIWASLVISSMKANTRNIAPIEKHSNGNKMKLVANAAAQVKITTHK